MTVDVAELRELAHQELAQRRESGYDVSAVDGVAETATADELTGLLARLEAAPRRPDWPYDEPSDWPGILAAVGTPVAPRPVDAGRYAEQVRAAWLGRVAGNMLGKPVELGPGATPERLRGYLEAVGSWPLTDYFPVADPMPGGFGFTACWPTTTRGNIDGSARDDDVDYTILGLHLLERYGSALTAQNVADEWLLLLPMHQTYTAERAAYRNLAVGIRPPASATHRNPYREWIGAQIRADAFGFARPGDPWAAARLAFVDASVSHVANGVYGEMWAAGLVAAAFTATSAREAVETSLGVIPPHSRLAEAVREVLAMPGAGLDRDAAVARIWATHGRYHWVHTINNAALLTAGILYGDGDFTATITGTVLGGGDTDSTGGTAGAVAGILAGPGGIPSRWTEPLHDTVRSALFGFDRSSVEDLAARTVAVRARLDR